MGKHLDLLRQTVLHSLQMFGSGARVEKLELPETALREAILNAIAHRDYRLTDHIQVNIFQDRVEVINPGGLVAGLKVRDLGRVSRPRNSLLFSMLERMNLVENIGSGIKRMRDSMKEYAMPGPIIEIGDTWFSISFPRLVQRTEEVNFSKPDNVASAGLSEGLNEGLKSLLKAINENSGVQAKDLAENLSRPIKTVERQIKTLTDKNLIERRGSKKTGGYWVLGG